MANCTVCDKDMGFTDRMNAKSFEGKCTDCSNEQRIINQMLAAGIDPVEIERKAQQKQLEADQRMEIDAEIDAILITTETAPDLNIIERLDIVTAQAAFEINNFKDILVGFMNPVKGRSSELEKQLDILKERALYGLKEKAHTNDANAIVAIDIDISTVTIGQISMLMLVASGTAVVIE